MILMFCNHIENELCSLNALNIIFIPQFTSKDLGKSCHQAFQKQHVVQEELSLIMHRLICMCGYTHTQYECFTNPYYILFYTCRLKHIDSCNGLDISVSLDHFLDTLDFEDATVLVQPQFQKNLVYVVPRISFVLLFQSFSNKAMFGKRIDDIFLFSFELILMMGFFTFMLRLVFNEFMK